MTLWNNSGNDIFIGVFYVDQFGNKERTDYSIPPGTAIETNMIGLEPERLPSEKAVDAAWERNR